LVTIFLHQPMGEDHTLYDLSLMIGGFRLKLTFEIMVADANGAALAKDVLDINLADLVPSPLVLDGMVTLCLQTLTAPEIKYL